MRFPGEAGFLGDGSRLFFSTVGIDADREERRDLRVCGADGGEARRLVAELGDVSLPSPSPDGSEIALLAGVGGRRQVFLVPVGGGPARVLTGFRHGAAGRPAWSPDGRWLCVAARPERCRGAGEPHRVSRVTHQAEPLGLLDDAVTDLYAIEVATGAVRQLTDDEALNAEPRFSPDGRSVAYLASFLPDRAWNWRPLLRVVDLDHGAPRTLVDSDSGARAFEWCADGAGLAYVGAAPGAGLWETHHGYLWTVPREGGEPRCRTAALDTGVGLIALETDLPNRELLDAPRLRVDGDAAYVNGQLGGRVRVLRVGLSGPESVEVALEREGGAYLVDFHPGQGVLAMATSFLEPPELVLGETPVTRLGAELTAGRERPRVRHLEVTAPDGLATEAWALTPAGAGPWPTVLHVHGGPWAAAGSIYGLDHELLLAAGIAVLVNNFRGSSGYGTEFSRLLGGEWGRAAIDHHAALDEAVRAGIADPDRLGAWGISHGGFSTCWLLGTSDRFRAGVAENPITSFAGFYAGTDSPWWMAAEFGGTPEEVPEVYRERSPLTHAANCRTPLLFVVGDDDLLARPTESEQYYRALKANRVPTEMLRLPGGGHMASINGPVAGRIAQDEALVAWFERHLTPRTGG